jgi:hypothetical protein
MRTVILRLNGPSGDGKLHGLAEVVGTGSSRAFTDDATLLSLLHAACGSAPGSEAPEAVED